MWSGFPELGLQCVPRMGAEKSPAFPRQRVRFQRSHWKFGVLKSLAKVFDVAFNPPPQITIQCTRFMNESILEV